MTNLLRSLEIWNREGLPYYLRAMRERSEADPTMIKLNADYDRAFAIQNTIREPRKENEALKITIQKRAGK